MNIFVITIKAESGEDYGPYLVKNKPSKEDLEKWLKKKFPDEFDEGEDGPGDFGSYLFTSISEVSIKNYLK